MPHEPEQEKGGKDSLEKILSDNIDDLALAYAVLAKKAKCLKSVTDVFRYFVKRPCCYFSSLTYYAG